MLCRQPVGNREALQRHFESGKGWSEAEGANGDQLHASWMWGNGRHRFKAVPTVLATQALLVAGPGVTRVDCVLNPVQRLSFKLARERLKEQDKALGLTVRQRDSELVLGHHANRRVEAFL